MDEFQSQIQTLNYNVLSNDGFCNAYTSLRTMSNEISVDYSTISKKLKVNNGEFCFCISKETKSIYYIKKI